MESVVESCAICHGEEWVCEDHPFVGWGEGKACCGGAGMPCQCNSIGHEDRDNAVTLFKRKEMAQDR